MAKITQITTRDGTGRSLDHTSGLIESADSIILQLVGARPDALIRVNNAPVERSWGRYIDHFRSDCVVLKTLLPRCGCSTSYQRHAHRGEFWFVEQGGIEVTLGEEQIELGPGDTVHIPLGQWHQLRATGEGVVVRELQYGRCAEEDIERKDP